MPVYEYRCSKCNYEFESYRSIISRDQGICTHCGSKAKRLVSMPSIRIVKPFYVLNHKGEILGKRADSYDSAERNLDIPPDYPNLLEV